MHAVDSAIGPEIEEDHLAPKLLETHGPVTVQPYEAGGKVGGMDPGLWRHILMHALLLSIKCL
jgi:hypothetical protein